MSKNYFFITLRCLLVICIIFIGYFSLKLTLMYVYPFIIGTVFALLIIPLVNRLETIMRLPRTLATLAVIGGILILFMSGLVLITTEIFNGTLYLADSIPRHFQSFISMFDSFINAKLIPLYEKIASLFYSLGPTHRATLTEYIHELNNYIAIKGGAFVQDFFLKIPSFLTILPNSLTVTIFIILATFFITNDWHKIQKQTRSIFPRFYYTVQELSFHLKTVILDYLKAQLVLIFITGCIIYSGLLILKIEHALTISLFITLVDLLPLIGTGIAFIPWILYLFFSSNYPLTIGLIILYIVVILVRQLLEPKILTASIGINPLLGLIILFICIQVFGGIGFLLTPLFLISLAVFKKSGIHIKILQFINGKVN